MGEIRKRGKVWFVRYYRDGRHYEESARTADYQVARDLLRDKEAEVAKGAPVSPRNSQYRFDDAARDLLLEYEVNKRRSARNLRTTIIKGHLMPWFRGRRMATITADD